jgi:hypothetical protein
MKRTIFVFNLVSVHKSLNVFSENSVWETFNYKLSRNSDFSPYWSTIKCGFHKTTDGLFHIHRFAGIAETVYGRLLQNLSDSYFSAILIYNKV